MSDNEILFKRALDYHSGCFPYKGYEMTPGKVCVSSSKPLECPEHLSLAYTPGVAAPALLIKEDTDKSYDYTTKGNLVAVISNGTAVLGLGNCGPAAAKPVMEGKGQLFKHFANVNVFDLEIDCEDPDRFVDIVSSLAPTFGGINLEDIKAPECFYIESRLQKKMDIPVFHDDQHGTAIVLGAAVLNAMHLTNKELCKARFVFSGSGAAATACIHMLLALGASKENIIVCDEYGVLYEGRNPLLAHQLPFARRTEIRTLREALVGADVFVGLSVGNIVDADMVRSMANDPLVMAMANPYPEISYDEAKNSRTDAIVCTGRSDYPNQVNNVLAFPFIFRGALDVRAKCINEEMKIAACQALAKLARQDVPESVCSLLKMDKVSFGSDCLLPKLGDPRVVFWVASAVAGAAINSGVARKILDIKEYRKELEKVFGNRL